MPEIVICKHQPLDMPEQDLATVRGFLFGVVDGLGDTNKSRWRRFWNWLIQAEAGEVATITTHRERIGWKHRRHMAMESAVFDAQERFADFDQFRVWLKIGAGHVDWVPGPRGGIVPVPKSISYAKLDEDGMAELHEKMLAFLQTAPATKALWPAASPVVRANAIAALLEGYL